MTPQRREEVRRNLLRVRERIDQAGMAAGRDPAGVTLVVVTKRFPPTDLELLAELGVRHVGENKDQEASAKIAALAPATRERLTVHFVGQLQRNKTRSVVTYVDLVHSVDRAKLVGALDRAVGAALAAGERTSPLGVLVQVDLDDHRVDDRGGAPPTEVPALAEAAAAAEHLHLLGVMAVAPAGLDAAGTSAAFDRLRAVAERLQAEHPAATVISAGMSADLELAVAAGATHLRVGSAILGSREPRR